MNAIGIGNYGMITGNYTRSTDTEQKQTSTSFADVVQNKLDDADKARSVSESHSQSCTGKPVWHWHDGQFGYSAEVYRNEGSTSEYTVKLKYDNGKEEERIVDAEKVNASSCNMVDLSVRLYHLEAEGKIENPAPEIILAHIYLRHRMPNANENTIVDYRSWYEQQLDLELQNDRNEKNNTASKKESLSDAIKDFEEAHKISAQDLKEEKDWRDMSVEEWDKMIEGVDKYVDAFKERQRQMKEMQDEAAQKAALEADPEMRTMAASSAALAVASGFAPGKSEEGEAEGVSTEEGVDHEKNWTKKLKTDDQTVLMTAKEAQKMERNALSKLQEVQLTDSTTVGVSSTRGATECASVDEEENKEKVWTITCIGKDGISSKKCQNGKVLSSWELKYDNPDDAKRVEDFIAGFKKDENLKFAGIKGFWNMFLKGSVTKDNLVQSGDVWEWIQ